VASIDGVDTHSGNLPLYFSLCHIIVLLSWQIFFLSLLGGDTYSLTPGDKLTRQSSVLLALNTTSYMQLADVT